MSHILISPAAVSALQAFAAAIETAAAETPWCSDELMPHTRGLADHLAKDSTGWIPGHLVTNALKRFEMLAEGHEAKTDAIKVLWKAATDAVDAPATPAATDAAAPPVATPAPAAVTAPATLAPPTPTPTLTPLKPPGA
jgi:hypothetical protein